MAKTMDDLLWSVSLGELLAQLDGEPPPLPDPSSLAEQLTKGKVQHADDFETFDEVFLHEVEGVLDGHIDLLADIMVHLGQKTGCAAEPPPDQRRRAGRYLANLIHAAYKEHRVGKELPGILISAGLHAALRCDPNRKYKAGDCEDFRHARVALPYYDIFCTEKSLKHLICTKPLAYDALYGTTVLSDDDEIITALCALKP
jgi:hypothetical protein